MSNVVLLDALIPEIYQRAYAEIMHFNKIDELIMRGGRGSLKSTIAGYMSVMAVVNGEGDSAICFRRHANGLRESVYAECINAIDRLGLGEYWTAMKSPLKLIYKPTGGVIMFRGMDDPQKIKGIKLEQGQFAFAWFEELQEVEDSATLRSIIQSVARGERRTKIIYSFNPPVSKLHWVNEEMKDSHRVKLLHTTYLDVPWRWNGLVFIGLAERLKKNNFDAYQNEYLGLAVGGKGMIFKNIKVFKHTGNEQHRILYRGVDFGFTKDPATYVVWAYNEKEHTITLVHEFYGHGIKDKTLAEEIIVENRHGFTVRCDNSEPKSISNLVDLGVLGAVGCGKGKDSVRFGIKWLQGLNGIYIDPEIGPETHKEFTKYEYLMRKGVSIGEFPDKNNHTIDASRYALEPAMIA